MLRHRASRTLASVSRRSLLRRHDNLERLLREVQRSVDRNHDDISFLGKGLRQFRASATGEEFSRSMIKLQDEALPYLRYIMRFVQTAPRLVGGTLLALFVGRSVIYKMLADESEQLGRQVLDANIRNVIATLDGVAKDPDTVAVLVELLRDLVAQQSTKELLLALVVELLEAADTRRSLIGLLIKTFEDEQLTRETGRFLLEALDGADAREMLDEQTARLVSAACLDEQVQRDAGEGVRSAVKNALLPRALLGWFARSRWRAE